MPQPSVRADALPDIRLTRRAALRLGPIAAALATCPAIETGASPAPSPIAGVSTGTTASIACTLNVRLNAERRTLAGTESIVWQNTTGREQDALYLRLYPNAAYYGDAQTTIDRVSVDGAPSTARLRDEDPTVASIPLGRTVKPGDATRIDLAFETTVPPGMAGSFGIFGFDAERGSWALADWYPILAGWEPERNAWYLDPPTPFGDPTFAETATYALTLEAPAGLVLVSTGDLVSEVPEAAAPDATTVARVESGPVREFAMVLLPESSDTEGPLQRHPSGMTAATPEASPATAPATATGSDPAVSLLLPASADIPGLGDAILGAATAALPRYRALLVPLREATLEIVGTRLAGANGVSWPGMIWLDLTTIARDGALGEEERPGLRFAVIHEVGHQWIGGVLGLNANDHGFLLEGLTNALAIGVIREAFGAEAAIEAMGRFVAGPYSGLVRDERDVLADQPLTNDTNTVLRALGVYGKAGLGFEAIRQEMGDAAWRSALGTFAASFRDRIFTPDDLREALMATAPSPERVQALWTFWFEAAATTLPDIDPIVQGAGR